MNKLVKRGFSAWLIFIKNKVAGAVMMFISGLMMALAGFQGNGNDTKTLPSVIALSGVILAFWAFYRLGYIKSNMDKLKDREAKVLERKVFRSQIFETMLYLLIMALGIFLFINEMFTNTILDLMCGGFTILNGVFGAIYVYKRRENKNFGWKFRVGLTTLEFAMGTYFILLAGEIGSNLYLYMGSLTTLAGIIEIGHAITRENLENAVKDGKDIIRAFKDDVKETED